MYWLSVHVGKYYSQNSQSVSSERRIRKDTEFYTHQIGNIEERKKLFESEI
jgi:hypothetical protein